MCCAVCACYSSFHVAFVCVWFAMRAVEEKRVELIFVIHNIPLTCLNCLLILLNVGRTSGKQANERTTSNSAPAQAHQHSAYSYVSYVCTMQRTCSKQRQRLKKKKKKQKQF